MMFLTTVAVIFGVMGFGFDRRWVLLALFVDLLGMLPSLVQ